MKITAVLSFYCLLCCACNAQTGDLNTIGVLSYNVENLYDTTDDPLIDDQEFLPSAGRKWDTEKYTTKLEHLARVISSASDDLPVLVGLIEIENKKVLEDLIATDALKKGNYGIIHFDSPDERGIDVALLYNKNIFRPEKYYPIRVDLHADQPDYTRDILFVSGQLRIAGHTEQLNIYVNHWPSRSEGEEVSAPKRAAAAQVLRNSIDSLYRKNANANIIIMGDFNDTPYDKSITSVLGAADKAACQANCLLDLMRDKQAVNQGSYNYKGNWQALDQFIISSSMLDNNALETDTASVVFVKKDFMLYHSDKYGDSPNRSFSGTSYHAGYSDHLPVYMQLIFK